ncbi:MAG: hypothetical protein IT169_07825 [Bryobacterales bacterium]|nr:hypothetical protein [Bryobacterales bacterium]
MSDAVSRLEEPGSPWIAFAGIFVPGAGHWLAGERTKAIALFAIIHLAVIGTLLGGAAVAPPVPPEPMFIAGLSSSDPIGNAMRTMEQVAQRSNGVSVWAAQFFGYDAPFDGTSENSMVTNLLNLAGILNLLAVFYLFDEKRAEGKAFRLALAARAGKGKKG